MPSADSSSLLSAFYLFLAPQTPAGFLVAQDGLVAKAGLELVILVTASWVLGLQAYATMSGSGKLFHNPLPDGVRLVKPVLGSLKTTAAEVTGLWVCRMRGWKDRWNINCAQSF
jgi:hypothetical protein